MKTKQPQLPPRKGCLVTFHSEQTVDRKSLRRWQKDKQRRNTCEQIVVIEIDLAFDEQDVGNRTAGDSR